jgi:hypothetical protein
VEPFPNQEKQKRYIVGVVALLAFLAVSIWGWAKVHDIASRKVQRLVTKIQTKSGIPVSIGHWRIGFSGAHFEDIVIGDNAMAIISEVSADVTINPFSDHFGELQSVTIHRVEIKADLDELVSKGKKLSSKRAIKKYTKSSRSFESNPLDKFFKMIPVRRSLVLNSGGLILVDNDGNNVLAVKGLKVLINKLQKKIVFKAPAIRTLGGAVEKGIYGKIKYSKKKHHYDISIKQKLQNSKQNTLVASYSPKKEKVELDFNINKFPPSAVSYLKQKNIYLPTGRAKGQIKAQKEFATWKISSSIMARNIRVKAPFVSTRTLGPIPFSAKVEGQINITNQTFAMHESSITLMQRKDGKLYNKSHPSLSFNGSWNHDNTINVNGKFKIPSTRCQSMIDIAPIGLIPTLVNFRLGGRFLTDANFRFNTANPEEFYYHLNRNKFNCTVLEVPYAYSPEHLNGPFTVTREVSKDDVPLEIPMSPLAHGYSDYESISPYVNKAFVTSEDAGFWKHNGIDSFAIENALRTNLVEQRVAIGGSTITMQTVKNLFLNHRRTISRKMQELFLAWHLEKVVDKKRIIELYMNVAEFGPGIYGVTKASLHYFDKAPFDLSLRESAFLAALLPSPVRRYKNFCNGTPTTEFKSMMDNLLKRMNTLGKVDSNIFNYAMTNRLRFNDEARNSSTTCSNLSRNSKALPQQR